MINIKTRKENKPIYKTEQQDIQSFMGDKPVMLLLDRTR